MTTLIELRDMLAKAKGPSRVLDAILSNTLTPLPVGSWKANFASGVDDLAPDLTSSIDAALATVERRIPIAPFHRTSWFRLDIGKDYCRASFDYVAFGEHGPTWRVKASGRHVKPALAILLALIEALIAEEKV